MKDFEALILVDFEALILVLFSLVVVYFIDKRYLNGRIFSFLFLIINFIKNVFIKIFKILLFSYKYLFTLNKTEDGSFSNNSLYSKNFFSKLFIVFKMFFVKNDALEEYILKIVEKAETKAILDFENQVRENKVEKENSF
jgi:hypothetical protein